MERNEHNKKMRWSLQGKTALVTGGTKGIGHEIVEELARFGAEIYTCSRDETELRKCLEEWKKLKFNVSGSVCDVSCRIDREKLMENVSLAFNGTLDILVNNAAVVLYKATVECTAVDYSVLMTTNVESVFHLSQLAHPLLKASGSGSIINLS